MSKERERNDETSPSSSSGNSSSSSNGNGSSIQNSIQTSQDEHVFLTPSRPASQRPTVTVTPSRTFSLSSASSSSAYVPLPLSSFSPSTSSASSSSSSFIPTINVSSTPRTTASSYQTTVSTFLLPSTLPKTIPSNIHNFTLAPHYHNRDTVSAPLLPATSSQPLPLSPLPHLIPPPLFPSLSGGEEGLAQRGLSSHTPPTSVIVRPSLPQPQPQQQEHSLLFDCLNRDRPLFVDQTQALDLRTNIPPVPELLEEEDPPYPPAEPVSGYPLCEWCRENRADVNCVLPIFCRDNCFESYRRSHYKKRICCARCGGRGDWDVSKESLDHCLYPYLHDLPAHFCQNYLKNLHFMDPNRPSRLNVPHNLPPTPVNNHSQIVHPFGADHQNLVRSFDQPQELQEQIPTQQQQVPTAPTTSPSNTFFGTNTIEATTAGHQIKDLLERPDKMLETSKSSSQRMPNLSLSRQQDPLGHFNNFPYPITTMARHQTGLIISSSSSTASTFSSSSSALVMEQAPQQQHASPSYISSSSQATHPGNQQVPSSWMAHTVSASSPSPLGNDRHASEYHFSIRRTANGRLSSSPLHFPPGTPPFVEMIQEQAAAAAAAARQGLQQGQLAVENLTLRRASPNSPHPSRIILQCPPQCQLQQQHQEIQHDEYVRNGSTPPPLPQQELPSNELNVPTQSTAALNAANTLVRMTANQGTTHEENGHREVSTTPQQELPRPTPPPTTAPEPYASAFVAVIKNPSPSSSNYNGNGFNGGHFSYNGNGGYNDLNSNGNRTGYNGDITSTILNIPMVPQPIMGLPSPLAFTGQTEIVRRPVGTPRPQVRAHRRIKPKNENICCQRDSSYVAYSQQLDQQRLHPQIQLSNIQHQQQLPLPLPQLPVQQLMYDCQPIPPQLPPRPQASLLHRQQQQQQHQTMMYNMMYGSAIAINNSTPRNSQPGSSTKRARLDSAGERSQLAATAEDLSIGCYVPQHRIPHPSHASTGNRANYPNYPIQSSQDMMYPPLSLQQQLPRSRYSNQQQPQYQTHPLIANHLQQQFGNQFQSPQPLQNPGMNLQWPHWPPNMHAPGNLGHSSGGDGMPFGGVDTIGPHRGTGMMPMHHINDGFQVNPRGGSGGVEGYSSSGVREGRGYNSPGVSSVRPVRRELPRNFFNPSQHPNYSNVQRSMYSQIAQVQPPHQIATARRPSATVTSAQAAAAEVAAAGGGGGVTNNQVQEQEGEGGAGEGLLRAGNPTVFQEGEMTSGCFNVSRVNGGGAGGINGGQRSSCSRSSATGSGGSGEQRPSYSRFNSNGNAGGGESSGGGERSDSNTSGGGEPSGSNASGRLSGSRASVGQSSSGASAVPSGSNASCGPSGSNASGGPSGSNASGGPSGSNASGGPSGLRTSGGPSGLRTSGGPSGFRTSGGPSGLRTSGGPSDANGYGHSGSGSSGTPYFETPTFTSLNVQVNHIDVDQMLTQQRQTARRGRGGGRRGGCPGRTSRVSGGVTSTTGNEGEKPKQRRSRGDNKPPRGTRGRGRGGRSKAKNEHTAKSETSSWPTPTFQNDSTSNQSRTSARTTQITSFSLSASGRQSQAPPSHENQVPMAVLPPPPPVYVAAHQRYYHSNSQSQSVLPPRSEYRSVEVQVAPSTLAGSIPTPTPTAGPSNNYPQGNNTSQGFGESPCPLAIPMFLPLPIFVPVSSSNYKAALKEITSEPNSSHSPTATVQPPQSQQQLNKKRSAKMQSGIPEVPPRLETILGQPPTPLPPDTTAPQPPTNITLSLYQPSSPVSAPSLRQPSEHRQEYSSMADSEINRVIRLSRIEHQEIHGTVKSEKTDNPAVDKIDDNIVDFGVENFNGYKLERIEPDVPENDEPPVIIEPEPNSPRPLIIDESSESELNSPGPLIIDESLPPEDDRPVVSDEPLSPQNHGSLVIEETNPQEYDESFVFVDPASPDVSLIILEPPSPNYDGLIVIVESPPPENPAPTPPPHNNSSPPPPQVPSRPLSSPSPPPRPHAIVVEHNSPPPPYQNVPRPPQSQYCSPFLQSQSAGGNYHHPNFMSFIGSKSMSATNAGRSSVISHTATATAEQYRLNDLIYKLDIPQGDDPPPEVIHEVEVRDYQEDGEEEMIEVEVEEEHQEENQGQELPENIIRENGVMFPDDEDDDDDEDQFRGIQIPDDVPMMDENGDEDDDNGNDNDNQEENGNGFGFSISR